MTNDTVLFFQSASWNHDNLKLNGLTAAARQHNWRIQLVAKSDLSSNDLRDMLEFWKPLGCIIDCGNRESIPSCEEFKPFPVIYLDCEQGIFGKRANYISHDTRPTVELCARELLQLNLRAFAYIGHFGHQYWSENRKNIFASIIQNHGLHLDVLAPDKPMLDMEFRLLLQSFIKTLPKPCGIFAVNDEIGEMTTVAVLRAGLRIPEDIAIVSIDNNIQVCETLQPTLTSVEVDFESAGQLSAELLSKISQSKTQIFSTEFFGPIRIVHRASTQALSDHTVATMAEQIRKKALAPLRAKTIKELARSSNRNAEKRFKKATGHSITDEIHKIRLAKATELLAKSHFSIPEIVGMCGYSSESFFRKVFKRTTGTTPLKFRRQNQVRPKILTRMKK